MLIDHLSSSGEWIRILQEGIEGGHWKKGGYSRLKESLMKDTQKDEQKNIFIWLEHKVLR